MTRITCALLLAVMAFIFSNAAMLPAAAQTVHALLVIMDEDHLAGQGKVGIGPGCAVDRYYIENLLLGPVEDVCKVQTKTLLSSEGTATPYEILEWLDGVNPEPDDVVFIYYSGHGGMADWGSQRTFLSTLDERMWRDELVGWIETEASDARLRMLITDCCSNTNEPPPKSQVEKATDIAAPQMFKNLFLEHSGFLHITGATEGEYSWASNPEHLDRPWTFFDGRYGGWFTRGFIKSLDAVPDINEDGFVSWDEVFFRTRANTMETFEKSTFSAESRRNMERLGITNQTPKAYSIPMATGGPASAQGSILDPFRVIGDVTVDGTDDEIGKDEYVHRVYSIDTYLNQGDAKASFEVPDTRWGGECRVEVQLTPKVVGHGQVEITANAKLFEGTSVWTTDKEDEYTITFTVGARDGTVQREIQLRNTETGGGDHAEISLNFSVVPPGMALIRVGEFQMGSNDGRSNEQPVHTVYVDAFYMDVYEVTNAQYKVFVDANPQWQKNRIDERFHDGGYLRHWINNNYPSGEANHPVVSVSWYAAMAYAQWVGKRLPTEAEWEKAARGGLNGKKYPWGNASPNGTQGNFADKSIAEAVDWADESADDGYVRSAPVGTYPPNGYGLYDMAGNVFEWCMDIYSDNAYAEHSARNPFPGGWMGDNFLELATNPDFVHVHRVLRGGSWGLDAQSMRVASRFRDTPASTHVNFGFRCARAVTP